MKRLAAFFLIASVASWIFADGIHIVELLPGEQLYFHHLITIVF